MPLSLSFGNFRDFLTASSLRTVHRTLVPAPRGIASFFLRLHSRSAGFTAEIEISKKASPVTAQASAPTSASLTPLAPLAPLTPLTPLTPPFLATISLVSTARNSCLLR